MSKKKKIVLTVSLLLAFAIIYFSANYYRKYRIYYNINQLKSGNPVLQQNAIDDLAAIGEPAVEPLIFAISYDPVHAGSGLMHKISDITKQKDIRTNSEKMKEESLNLKVGSVIALGEIRDARAVPVLAGLLDNKNDYKLDKRIFDALLKIGDPAVPTIIALLRHERLKVRCRAALLLGDIRNTDSVKPLADVFYNDDVEIKDRAVWAMVELGEPSVEYFLKGLEHEDYAVRWRSVDALGKIGDKRAVKPLMAMFYKNRKDSFLEKSIVKSLWEIGSPEALEVLIIADSSAHITADEINSKIKGPSTVAVLLRLIRENKGNADYISNKSAELLEEVEDPEAQDALLKAINDEDEFVRKSAILALGKQGDHRAVVPLLELIKKYLEEHNMLESYWVVPGIMDESKYDPNKSSKIRPDLILNSNKNKLKDWFPAAYALLEIEDTKKYDVFIEKLDDEKNELRPTLLFFLEYLWHEKGCFHLMDKADSSDYRIRYILVKIIGAKETLWRKKKKDILPNVYTVEYDAPINGQEYNLIYFSKDKDYRVRAEAARAFGNYRCGPALPYLKRLLKDKNRIVRERAREAIKKIEED